MCSLLSQDEGDIDRCPICCKKACLAEQCKASIVTTMCCNQAICCECVMVNAMRCKCCCDCQQVIVICPFCRQVTPLSAVALFLASKRCKNRLCGT